ncbi:hypothetical protein PBAC_24640 [Pedobacter glucosidilyticus]|uniref:DUF4835 family protein n=1 Tax=Pedobacter aquae TaxID=2605747 RepID=A0A5C0VJ28_9SPHI|nr:MULTISPECIES: DUF4835 family protein [Pedobacter]KHJ37396.1 hypothetical protein PBAC_24640 [Pedobacter glucosidilyticus]QEK51783.1 DUF4835 family protein [Pedobacter aquae]
MKHYLLSLLFCIISYVSYAQDLNARVQILSPQIQNTNKRPLEVLETAMSDFLNNRKWSTDELLATEKIDCNFVINLKEWDGSSNFKAEAQIISSRPVFNSSYNTTLLSINDRDFDFSYSEGQPLDFSDQNFINNLSSMLAFYAYIIVGLDYDSFTKLGGANYFNKAQDVLNNAQNAPFSGWKAFEGLRNRYWLIENITSKNFLPLREIIYDYHREGLDVMAENAAKGRKNILSILPKISEIDKQRQGAMFNQAFFTAKADEITNIFSKSDPSEKLKVYNILVVADPANTSTYEALKNNK